MKRANINTYDILVTNFNKSHQNDVIEKKVSKQFTQYGETKGIFVKENTQGKFVVVKYLSEPDADRAVREANGALLDGLPIIVKRMQQRQKKPQKNGDTLVTSGTWVCRKDSQKNSSQLGKNPDIVPSVEPVGSSSPGPEGEPFAAIVSSLNIQGQGQFSSMVMLITHIETPTLFWCQELLDSPMLELHEISNKLLEICPSAPRLVGRLEPSKIYGAKFSEDKLWYRCQIKGSHNSEKVRVQYIDFGNFEEVDIKELVELPADLTVVKPFAAKVMLHNTRFFVPKEKEAIQYLRELTDNKQIIINPTFRLPDGSGLFAHFFCDGINLSQDLIDKGFAATKPTKQQQQPQPHQHNDPPPTAQFHIGLGGGYAMSGARSLVGGDNTGFRQGAKTGAKKLSLFGGDSSNRQLPAEFDKMHIGGPRFSVPSVSRGNLLPGGEKPGILSEPLGVLGVQSQQQMGPTYSDLKIELQNKTRTLEKTSTELSTTRAKMKTLQQEYQVLTVRLEETNIVQQLNTAASLAEKIRELRNQFPDDKPTAIDKAIELVCSDARLVENSVAALPPLVDTLTKYRQMQQDISQMHTKQDVLMENIEERDCVRRVLFQELSACITEMEATPFTERAQAVRLCQEELIKYYENFINAPVESNTDFNTALAQYKEFKMNKQKDFEQARLNTNQLEQLTQDQLIGIRKKLSLTPNEDIGECDFDLVTQLKHYCDCMQQEIKARKEAITDCCFLTALIQCVYRDMQAEILCINNYIRFESEFQTLRSGMESWLNNKPTLDDLLTTRQNLRSLKSRLRHKLADKHDAEECEDKVMLEEVQKDVADIQQEIHKILLMEEKELEELSELVNSHFPEFLILHPDSGLDIQLKFKGLVKPSHEVNHYNLTPVPGANGRLFFSKFGGQDVILMECLLSDSHHLGREEFLTQLMAYVTVTHRTLLHPSAVFFDKNNRHAYLQFDKGRADILANHVEFGAQEPKKNSKFVKSVVEGLAALHSKSLVHADVNPYSVLHRPDGTASLLPPDLSCRPLDRAKNRFTSHNGLVFMAPEIETIPAGVEPTSAVDMYCLGILILYVSHPKESVALASDGSFDFQKVKLDSSLSSVVKSLTSYLPHLRPTANMLLQTHLVLNIDQGRYSPVMAGDSSVQFSTSSAVHFPNTCTQFPMSSSSSSVTASLCSSSVSIPSFTMPDVQHPPPTINFQQPPPPPPNGYSAVMQHELPFASIPVTLPFSILNRAEPQQFLEANQQAASATISSSLMSIASGRDHHYHSSVSGIEAAAGSFEEAAVKQEQQENESRGGPVSHFPVSTDSGGQEEFEIGTFSIEDVNGTVSGGDSSKGRKITRQASADEQFEDGNGNWPISDDESDDE